MLLLFGFKNVVETGDLVVVQQSPFHGDEGEQGGPDDQHDQDADGQPGHGQHDEQHNDHDHGGPRSGWSRTRMIGMPGHDQEPEDVAPGQALLLAARAVGGDGQDQGQHGELGGLQLQRTEAEPARRALGAAPHHEDTEQREDDEPVEDHGQRFEPPVVEHGQHHHGDDAEDDEEALLLEERLWGPPPGRAAVPRVAV